MGHYHFLDILCDHEICVQMPGVDRKAAAVHSQTALRTVPHATGTCVSHPQGYILSILVIPTTKGGERSAILV